MIDIAFDFRSDTPPGKDPDTWSPTLRTYHQLLWSKRLPRGALFDLDVSGPPYYFHHRSELGEFWLSSDAVVPSFRYLTLVIERIPEVEREEFMRIGYTIGGMMVFPAQRVDGIMTINMARGCHPRIKDRFDLTVECIRRHYLGDPSPLGETLARYADFFGLFGEFAGYVDFFHLQTWSTTTPPRSGSSRRSRLQRGPRAANPGCIPRLPPTRNRAHPVAQPADRRSRRRASAQTAVASASV